MIIDKRSRDHKSTEKKTANFQQSAEKIFVTTVQTENKVSQEFHVWQETQCEFID